MNQGTIFQECWRRVPLYHMNFIWKRSRNRSCCKNPADDIFYWGRHFAFGIVCDLLADFQNRLSAAVNSYCLACCLDMIAFLLQRSKSCMLCHFPVLWFFWPDIIWYQVVIFDLNISKLNEGTIPGFDESLLVQDVCMNQDSIDYIYALCNSWSEDLFPAIQARLYF